MITTATIIPIKAPIVNPQQTYVPVYYSVKNTSEAVSAQEFKVEEAAQDPPQDVVLKLSI